MGKMRPRERNTVLAALRCYQQVISKTGGDIPEDLWVIATNDGQHEFMDIDEIEELCEVLNV